ncbi:MAG TPA: family 78 glycoside hydrolase catalytic domain [Chthoniobacteraceae bacterium]|nr:family 78 glycoside hydrolase catalytic domain [Chthoniobacteraceae bacterium]
MKPRCLPGLAVASAMVCCAHAAITTSQLRCEYLFNPLGIDVAQPRLSWILTGAGSVPQGVKQGSYHILVASSPQSLAAGKGDLWDSGEVKTDETSGIAYGGGALASRERCYWKVRITDSQGRQSPWSPSATWEMGLLQPGDWQAKWLDAPRTAEPGEVGKVAITKAIYETLDRRKSKDVTALVAGALKDNNLSLPASNATLGGDPAENQVKELRVDYTLNGRPEESVTPENQTLTLPDTASALPCLRKDFSLDKPIARARLYATALGLYDLHLNGQRVGDHLLAPDWTDYSKRSRYQDYDVTALVKNGANTLAGYVGNGWYSGHTGNGGYQVWGTTPALFAQLEVTYQDGTVERVVTDGSWKIHAGPILAADNMMGESYDARREIAGWDQPGLEVSGWANAAVRAEPERALSGQVDEPVRQTGELLPKSVKETRPGHWTYDLGQNMVGFVRLKVKAPAGTKVTIRHAEMLNPDGTIYTANLRGAAAIDTYVCKGGGIEIWQPHFTFHGFRYVELTGLPNAPGKDAVTGIVIGTAFRRVGSFSSSDPLINQLQSNIVWGMRGNYLSVPTDCPQRDERMGWMGDAQIFVRSATYDGDVAAFFTKWMVDVDDDQYPDGRFPQVAPNPPAGKGGHEKGGVPGWSDAGVIIPWTIYMAYGDTRMLEENLPAMKKWVDWCTAHSTNGIRDHDRGSDYGDWLSQHESTSKELIGTAYYAYSTDLLAKSCAAAGDTGGAQKYGQLFDQIKAAFNQHYVLADGHIKEGTQCAYAMALRFNLLPDNLRAKAGQYLAEDIAAHGNHLTTGFIGVSYLLPALCAENQTATAYRLFLQKTFPSWLFSVLNGATTIWERWDGWTPEHGFQDPGMNSFNHYSLGSCEEWMYDSVAGIGTDTPGFSHIVIRPLPDPAGGLTHAEGSYDSIHGRIATKWTLKDHRFTLSVTIPLNTTATVELPAPDRDGKKEIPIGSGDYQFACVIPPAK